MGFTEIEKAGKQMFEQFPAIKRSAKRVYQLASVATSNEKFKSEGDIVRVSPDDGYEYFYGYYDKSPWDATDRYMICIKVKQAYKSVAPKEPGVVGLIDTKNGNKFYKIGTTHSWNVQQSCMAQWMGPDFKSRIIYNDFRDGKYCSVIYSLKTKSEEKVLPLPVYDVARDGSFALSLDFSRLHRMRPGYGYSNLPEGTKGELCPDKPCIWKMDIETGEVTELFKYTDMAAFEPDESMVGAEHKVNHLMISPNGKRFMVLHRWFQKGRKHTRLVTVNVDKTEMYNLSDDVFVSHCYWKNDEEILSFLRKKETGDHYYLMKDKTQEYKMYWPELNTDGHCSYSPDGKYIITDTYPNRKRNASVYLCTEDDNKSRRIARVFAPFRYDNDCRCDLHPRWNRAGDKICIDSVHEGKRGLYMIGVYKTEDAKQTVEEQSANGKKLNVLMINTVPTIYDGITMTILNYITNMDLTNINMGFIAINHIEDSIRETLGDLDIKVYELPDRNKNQLKYMFQLAKVVRGGKYKVVHAHGNSCTLAIEMMGAWLGGAKVRCPHSHNTKCAHNTMHKLLKPFFNIFYTHGFACGDEAGKWLYQDKDFVVLKNGTNTGKYAFNPEYRAEYRKKLGIEDKVAVGHVAHFTYHKNHEFLIRAFKKVVVTNPNYVLVLVGSGKYEDNIKDMVKDSHIEDNVIFMGTSLEISQILSAMDFMVLPSLYEGLPNVVIEWQASGLPILLADTITKECEMSNLLKFIPLKEDVWAKQILEMPRECDRVKTSADAIQSIKEAGYDIKEQANVLKKYYLRYAGGGVYRKLDYDMPTKTKILTVSTSGLEKIEGISTVIFDNYSLFDKDIFDLDIVAAGKFSYPLAWKFERIGVTVQHLPSRKDHIFKYVKALAMLFRRNRYDALYIHGSSAIMSVELVMARHCGCKVRVAHSHNTTCDHKRADKLLRPVFYRSYTEALACGDAAGRWLYGERPFHVINNGRSIEKFKFSSERRDGMRDNLGLRDNEMAIGHVGNFNNQKNQIYLVYVLKELLRLDSNVKLFLIGDGEKRHEVEKAFENQGIRDWVVFTGSIDSVPDVLQAMDVMLLPSIHEGFPLVAVEWQIAGLACIFSDRVTRDCAYTDLVHYLPLNNDYKMWAEQIVKFKGYNRQKSSDLAVELTRKQGFDLEENAKMLQSYFMRTVA